MSNVGTNRTCPAVLFNEFAEVSKLGDTKEIEMRVEFIDMTIEPPSVGFSYY